VHRKDLLESFVSVLTLPDYGAAAAAAFCLQVRRKDWLESFAHHIVTLGLMYYSWYANFTRPGVIVMLLHDISDIFLEAAKLARYAEKEAMALYLFVVFAVSWVILRVILFPAAIIVRTLVDPIVLIAIPYNINPQPHYSAFGTMFLLLFFLHLYWTYLIFKVIYKQLKTGSTDDVREEDSDDE
jgi:ceramide synthetase